PACSPNLPRSDAGAPQVFKLLLVLKRVHRSPKPVIRISDQLPFANEPFKWPIHEFFPLAHVVEDFRFEDEEPAVDANRTVIYGVNSRNQIAFAFLQRNQVIAKVRSNCEEASDLVLLMKVVQLLREWEIRQSVTVIGKKFFIICQVPLDSL